MRLLYFTIGINILGGLSRIVIEKINWLAEHGYNVTLCNIERIDVVTAYPLDPRVKVVRGNFSTLPGNAFTRLVGVISAINRVQQIIREVQPDVIFNAHCPLVTWILPFIKKNGELSFFRDQRMPVIMEMHKSRHGLDMFNKRFMNRFSRWLHHWSTRWVYSKYDRFVVLTNGDKEDWNTRNSIVIPNFSSMNKIEKIKDFSQQESHQIIVLARLSPEKRIDLMIQIWAKLAKKKPNWHVKVLGTGSMRPELEEMVAQYGLQDSFLMPGAVKDVTDELESSEIFCFTAENEGFGIVLIEAMLKGVPVISFEYNGIEDIVTDGVDGYVIPFGDIDAYAEKLNAMMDSESLRVEFRQKAFESMKRFDKENVMKMWANLISSLSNK